MQLFRYRLKLAPEGGWGDSRGLLIATVCQPRGSHAYKVTGGLLGRRTGLVST